MTVERLQDPVARCRGLSLPMALLMALLVSLAGNLDAHAAVTPWVPIFLDNEQLEIETRIESIRGRSVINTSADFNFINTRFLRKHNLRPTPGNLIRVVGPRGDTTAMTWRNIPIELLGTELTFEEMVETEMHSSRYQAIIGAGFLKVLVFQIDFPGSRMRAIAPETIDMKQLSNIRTTRDPRGLAPIIEVELDGRHKAWLELNTAYYGGILLSRNKARRVDWLQGYDADDRGGDPDDGADFTLPAMTMGEFTVDAIPVEVPSIDDEPVSFRSEDHTGSRVRQRNRVTDGYLGYEVLRHFIVTIDFDGGLVRLDAPE